MIISAFGFALEDAQQHLNSDLLLVQFVPVSLKQPEFQQAKPALTCIIHEVTKLLVIPADAGIQVKVVENKPG